MGNTPASGPTSGPTTAPATAPTSGPTTAPATAPTSGPTTTPASGPTTAPTSGPTTAPTSGPTPKTTPRVVDPELTAFLETETQPIKVAQGKVAPNRLSIMVPEENTVFSLGAPGDEARRTFEPGIRGETDNHVHFWAKGANALLRLGTTGKHNADTLPNDGYLVHTSGHAKQESAEAHTVQSLSGNLLLRANGVPPPPPPPPPGGTAKPPAPLKTIATLQSDHGFAEVVGGHQSTFVARDKVVVAAASDFVPEKHPHGDKLAGWAGDFCTAKVAKSLLNGADIIASIESLYRSYNPVSNAAEHNKLTWRSKPNVLLEKTIADAAKLALSTYRLANEWVDLVGQSKVGVYATGSASVTGNFAASMFGGTSASVTSVLSASLLGGTVSVKGMRFASIWGMREVSVKGRVDAKVEGERGNASLRGHTGVEVSSFKGPVSIQGNGNVKLASLTGQAHVHGAKGATFYAGPSSGHGVRVSDRMLILGKISKGANTTREIAFDEKHAITINSKEMLLRHGNAGVSLQGDSVAVLAQTGVWALKVDENFEVRGGKLLLG